MLDCSVIRTKARPSRVLGWSRNMFIGRRNRLHLWTKGDAVVLYIAGVRRGGGHGQPAGDTAAGQAPRSTQMKYRKFVPYIHEVQELGLSLLRRLTALEQLSQGQIEKCDYADVQAAQAPDYTPKALKAVSSAQIQDQGAFFDELEAFLAGWARLSLLFFPVTSFRKVHAQKLRELFDMTSDDQLSNRELRDSWMHFDERLARAISLDTFGNRQAFVRSHQVGGLKDVTLRLMVMDTLDVYFRTRDGKVECVSLKQLKARLLDLLEKSKTAKDKI